MKQKLSSELFGLYLNTRTQNSELITLVHISKFINLTDNIYWKLVIINYLYKITYISMPGYWTSSAGSLCLVCTSIILMLTWWSTTNMLLYYTRPSLLLRRWSIIMFTISVHTSIALKCYNRPTDSNHLVSRLRLYQRKGDPPATTFTYTVRRCIWSWALLIHVNCLPPEVHHASKTLVIVVTVTATSVTTLLPSHHACMG